MALIEVDGDEYQKLLNELHQARPSKQVLDKLGADPAARRQVLELFKKVNPNAVIPEIDAAKPVMDEIAATRAELAEMKKAAAAEKAEDQRLLRERRVKGTIDEGRDRRRAEGWTDEGISDLEKFMQDRDLADYDAAAALYEKTQPVEEPILPSNYGRSWDMFAPPADDETIKAAVGLPKGAAQDAALRRWQNNEIQAWFKENRGTTPGRATRSAMARR